MELCPKCGAYWECDCPKFEDVTPITVGVQWRPITNIVTTTAVDFRYMPPIVDPYPDNMGNS